MYFASIGVTRFLDDFVFLTQKLLEENTHFSSKQVGVKTKCTKTRIYHQPISAWNMCFCIVVNMRVHIYMCVLLEYTYIYDMIVCVFLFSSYTIRFRLLYNVTSWRTSQVQSGLTWPGTGAQNDLGVAASKLQDSRDQPIQDSDIFGPWGFAKCNIFLTGLFSTQKR